MFAYLVRSRGTACFGAAILACVSACGAEDEIVFAAYNVQNYLVTPVPNGGASSTARKSAKEKEALFKIIKEINPDILGISEMGSLMDFEDFKGQLAAVGLEYADAEHVEAADADRHLALVSRFPIVARDSARDVSFEVGGREEKVRRGILDVTVQVNPDYRLRLVGVHLKSKRAADAGEALLRRNEAHMLRKHADRIMVQDSRVKLLVYGDCNDTKNEPPIQEIMGPRDAPSHLADLLLRDSVGDRWTHYWKQADLYSRIDYIFVSRALWPEIILAKSRVYRSDSWNEASDHRAIVTTLRTTNSK